MVNESGDRYVAIQLDKKGTGHFWYLMKRKKLEALIYTQRQHGIKRIRADIVNLSRLITGHISGRPELHEHEF